MDKTEQQNKDEQFMRRALAEAEAARDEGEIPVGAVIVAGDRIIARAHNLTETLGDVTAHAEMQAITSAANQLGGKYLADCTLYVTVEPCIMCAGALGWAQVTRGLRCKRRETRFPHVRSEGAAPEVRGGERRSGGRMSNAYDRVLQGEALKALRFPTDTERRPCGHRTPPVRTPNATDVDTERRRPSESRQNAIGIGFNKSSF